MLVEFLFTQVHGCFYVAEFLIGGKARFHSACQTYNKNLNLYMSFLLSDAHIWTFVITKKRCLNYQV